MSKRFKGRTCVYCAQENASETADHVLAREFVPVRHRGQIPKVPACKGCNKEKSDLEHYLSTILLFGGRHPDASVNLTTDGPRRLAKNKKLHRELATGVSRLWSKEPSGVLVRAMTVPIDGERVEKLVGFIVRGLIFHHWSVVLGPDMTVDVLSLTSHGETFFKRFAKLNAKQRATGNIGDGALLYEGAQGVDNPAVSFWEVSLMGGVTMSGDAGEGATSRFGVMTGPKAIKARAEDRIRRRAYIIRP
jgi:hypothetical protein